MEVSGGGAAPLVVLVVPSRAGVNSHEARPEVGRDSVGAAVPARLGSPSPFGVPRRRGSGAMWSARSPFWKEASQWVDTVDSCDCFVCVFGWLSGSCGSTSSAPTVRGVSGAGSRSGSPGPGLGARRRPRGPSSGVLASFFFSVDPRLPLAPVRRSGCGDAGLGSGRSQWSPSRRTKSVLGRRWREARGARSVTECPRGPARVRVFRCRTSTPY